MANFIKEEVDIPINYKVLVHDNFMPEEFCDNLIEKIMCLSTPESYFPWYWVQVIPQDVPFQVLGQTDAVCDVKRNWQFCHTFWKNFKQNSDYFELIEPIITKINPNRLERVKANIHPWEETQVTHGFHIDTDTIGLTSIFYINDNNGKTIFRTLDENGDYEYVEVPSKKNRLITFDSRIMHSGTNQTDTPYRLVLNINYT